jgi:hypothetical protein
MKPLLAQWMIDMHTYINANPHIVLNGFREAGIIMDI